MTGHDLYEASGDLLQTIIHPSSRWVEVTRTMKMGFSATLDRERWTDG